MEVEGKLSSWWKDILRTCFGADEGVWLDLNPRLKLGEGRVVNFWQEAWLGNERLRDKFVRLYHLSTQQQAIVSDMGFWDTFGRGDGPSNGGGRSCLGKKKLWRNCTRIYSKLT